MCYYNFATLAGGGAALGTDPPRLTTKIITRRRYLFTAQDRVRAPRGPAGGAPGGVAVRHYVVLLRT